MPWQKLLLRKSILFVVAGLLLRGRQVQSQSVPDLSGKNRVLLEEVQNLTSKLGPTLWPEWKDHPPFLIKEQGREYLISHPKPPDDFHVFDSQTLHTRIWVRTANDSSANTQASYPINGVMTVIMSSLGPGEDAYVWVLKAAHESFHCYQGSGRIVNPFVGKFAEYNDLTFPFPYDDPDVLAALRLEAESVFRLATADPNDTATLARESRLLALASQVEGRLYSSPQFRDYKLLTEWEEGVARYTERELARAAAKPGYYKPLPEFSRMFPNSSYAAVWAQRYGDVSMINPIRFVGEGVRGRVMFYFLGMGKAYALDGLDPGWRKSYKNATLDELLQRSAKNIN